MIVRRIVPCPRVPHTIKAAFSSSATLQMTCPGLPCPSRTFPGIWKTNTFNLYPATQIECQQITLWEFDIDIIDAHFLNNLLIIRWKIKPLTFTQSNCSRSMTDDGRTTTDFKRSLKFTQKLRHGWAKHHRNGLKQRNVPWQTDDCATDKMYQNNDQKLIKCPKLVKTTTLI